MASGGGQSGASPSGSDRAGPPTGRGAGPTINLHQVNMTARHMDSPLVAAETLAMHGPVTFVSTPHPHPPPGPHGPYNYPPRQRRSDLEDQALWLSAPPEDVSDQFTDDELSRHIEEKYLSYVANCCNESSNTNRLVRKLKLDSATVLRLEGDYKESVREFIYHVLLTWKRRHPEFKVRHLVKILCESKLQKQALELKRYFSSIHSSQI